MAIAFSALPTSNQIKSINQSRRASTAREKSCSYNSQTFTFLTWNNCGKTCRLNKSRIEQQQQQQLMEMRWRCGHTPTGHATSEPS